MATQSPWRNLAEMDMRFERSRRRAAARRQLPPKRSWLASRTTRSILLALALFGVVGVPATLEISNADSQKPARAASPAPVCPVPPAFRQAFLDAAAKTGVPLSLLVAMAYQESRMDPQAHSNAGAQGLLQLMPSTARELAADANVPSANILAGARYLQQMLKRFGSLDLALSAYNAGPTAVARAAGAPTLETLSYVENVKLRAAALTDCR